MEQTNPLPNTPMPPGMSTTTPDNSPFSNKNVLIVFLVVFVIVLASLNAYLFIKLQNPAQAPIASPTPIVQASPTISPDLTTNWKVFHFVSLGIDLKLPPSWIPTTTEFTPNYIGPDKYINRLNLPNPLTPAEEENLQQNTISVQLLETNQQVRPTSYSRIIDLKNNKRLFFGVMNSELSTILDQILSTFKFLE